MSKSLKGVEIRGESESPPFTGTPGELSDDDYDPNDMYFEQSGVNLKGTECTRAEDVRPEDSGEHETSEDSSVQTAFKIKVEVQDMDIFTHTSTLRAKKRPRMVFDCVLIEKRRKVEGNKLDLYKNPKVRMSRTLALHPETVRYRLNSIGLDIQDQYFTIDKATREVMVTRLFMSATYGGNPVSAFPKIAKELLEEHKMGDFLYVSTDFQPHAPEIPGAPALWLDSVVAERIYRNRRTLTKIKDNKTKSNDKWLYVGQYDMVPANPPFLTVEEWGVQEKKFHGRWACTILNKNWAVCARILARKERGREPTRAEIEEVRARKLKYKNVLTLEDIKVAYSSGKERIGVWTMKCVGYDNTFQLQLSRRFPTWDPYSAKKLKVESILNLKTENSTKTQKYKV